MNQDNIIMFEKGKSFLDYWKIVRPRIKMIVLCAVAVPLAVLVVNFLQAPVYTADSYLRVRDPKGFQFSDMVGVNLPTEVGLIKSRSVLNDAMKTLQTDGKYKKLRLNKYFEDDVAGISRAKKNLEVERTDGSENIIKIMAKSHIPELASAIADVVVQTAIDHNLQFRKLEAQQIRKYIEVQQLKAADRLANAEEELRQFMVANKMVSMAQQGSAGSAYTLNDIDPLYGMESSIIPLKQKVASLSKIYNDDYPELKQARAELLAAESYRKKLTAGIEAYPDRKFAYSKLLREVDLFSRDYVTLGIAAREARLKEVAVVSDYFVVDYAIVPSIPTYPRIFRNLMGGTLIGIILGFSIAFILDHFDTTVKEVSEIEEDYGLTSLGRIPFIDLDCVDEKKCKKQKKWADSDRETTQEEMLANLSERLVTHYDPKHYFSEAYRQLYTNFVYSLQGDDVKSFAVSSPGPSEGKTSICVNMAVIAASLGKKVLIVDVDLRKPMIHNLFGLKQEPGLSNVLMDGVVLDKAIRESGVENVHLLTSGHLPPAPMLLLNSQRLMPIVEDLRAMYDFIIFDTPPIMAAADTSILASKIEGLLMVVGCNRTDRSGLADSLRLMSNARVRILGAVFNSISNAEHSYRYSHYGYGYGQKVPQKGFQRLIGNKLVYIQDYTRSRVVNLFQKNKRA